MPNGPCLEHRSQLVCQGPQQQTLESLSSPLTLNFNFVVTECPCVPATEYVDGSAVPETWPTWSFEGQGTSIGGQCPSPLPGQRDCQGNQLWSSCCSYLCPYTINVKGKPLPSISPHPHGKCAGQAEHRAPEPGAGSPGSPTQPLSLTPLQGQHPHHYLHLQ